MYDEEKYVSNLFSERRGDYLLPSWVHYPPNTTTFSLAGTSSITSIGYLQGHHQNSISNSRIVNSFELQLGEQFQCIQFSSVILSIIQIFESFKPNLDQSSQHNYEYLRTSLLISCMELTGFELQQIPKEFQTRELCLSAVKKIADNYEYVNPEYIDDEFIDQCLINNPKSITKIKDPPDEVIIKHIKKIELSDIPKQTFTIIDNYLSVNIENLRHIKKDMLSKEEWEYIKLRYFT